jgi:hypothetical protein
LFLPALRTIFLVAIGAMFHAAAKNLCGKLPVEEPNHRRWLPGARRV